MFTRQCAFPHHRSDVLLGLRGERAKTRGVCGVASQFNTSWPSSAAWSRHPHRGVWPSIGQPRLPGLQPCSYPETSPGCVCVLVSSGRCACAEHHNIPTLFVRSKEAEIKKRTRSKATVLNTRDRNDGDTSVSELDSDSSPFAFPSLRSQQDWVLLALRSVDLAFFLSFFFYLKLSYLPTRSRSSRFPACISRAFCPILIKGFLRPKLSHYIIERNWPCFYW